MSFLSTLQTYTRRIHRLPRRKRKKLIALLNLVFSVVLLTGILFGIWGYLRDSLFLVVFGSLLSFLPWVCLVLYIYLEKLRKLEVLRDRPLKDVHYLRNELKIAEAFLRSLSRGSKIDSCFVSKRDSIHHLYLERLVKGLEIRLSEIEERLASSDLEEIELGISLLETPLNFSSSNNDFIIDYTMPDIPPASWVGSLHHLVKELKNVELH